MKCSRKVEAMPNQYTHPISDESKGIAIVGVGGGGCNILEYLYEHFEASCHCIAVNTDGTGLNKSPAPTRILIGDSSMNKKGCDGDHIIGRKAAQESLSEIAKAFEGFHTVVLIACLGGGTGTGATPVFAEYAYTNHKRVIALMTLPFQMEGAKRMTIATEAAATIQHFCHESEVLSNQELLTIADRNVPFKIKFAGQNQLFASVITDILSH